MEQHVEYKLPLQHLLKKARELDAKGQTAQAEVLREEASARVAALKEAKQ